MRSVECAIAHDVFDEHELVALKATHQRGQRWLEQRAWLRSTVLDQYQERVAAHKDPAGLARQARNLVGEEAVPAGCSSA
ncbi:hypothetical protein ACWGLE_32205 [Streptomyces sp. NPDC055897]